MPAESFQQFIISKPEVANAMEDKIRALKGISPFETTYHTTSEKLASLLNQLLLAGYVYRNAEYAFTMRALLKLTSRSPDEYREAFERIDTDGSGYIDQAEVGAVFQEVFGRIEVPELVRRQNVMAFLELCDINRDNEISWDEFKDALGVMETNSLPEPASSDEEVAKLVLSGNITVHMDDKEVLVDVNKYLEALQEEERSVLADIRMRKRELVEDQMQKSRTLTVYVDSLSDAQFEMLSYHISKDVADAMARLVAEALRDPDGKPYTGDRELTFTEEEYTEMFWRFMIHGYRLREMEALGMAD